MLLMSVAEHEFAYIAGPSLKVVSTMSVGHGEYACHFFLDICTNLVSEHVSLPALGKRGIRLGYTPDVLTDAGSCFRMFRDAFAKSHFSCGYVHYASADGE